MTPETTIAMCGRQHNQLRSHLFPGDGCEAASILVCAGTPGPRRRLVVRHVLPVAHSACSQRTPDYLVWPGASIEDAIDIAEFENLTLVLIHSHPGGWPEFSLLDDESDQRTVPSILQAIERPHGTAIMTPDGYIRARLYGPEMDLEPVELVVVAGDDIRLFWNDRPRASAPLAFSSGMTADLNRLTAVVIGVSGIGSVEAEALARLGFGCVVLIDFDTVELKNLNRILNSTTADALAHRPKVDMFAAAIATYRPSGTAVPVAKSVNTREAVVAAAQADVIFSCPDRLEPRHIADLMANAFMMPLIDAGVVIPVRQAGDTIAIADVYGRVDYVQPGGPSLEDRGVYNPERLRAEYLRDAAPEALTREIEEGYFRGVAEEAPSVISLNMRAASTAVNEFLARAFPFRHDGNSGFARTTFSLAAGEEEYLSETEFDCSEPTHLGRGGIEPLLDLLALKTPRVAK